MKNVAFVLWAVFAAGFVPCALAQPSPSVCTRVTPAGDFPLSVIAGAYEPSSLLSGFKDLDGDGTTERLLVPYFTPYQVLTLKPRASGAIRYEPLFTPISRATNSLPRTLRSIAAADTNGDGKLEILVTWSWDNSYRTSNFWMDVYNPDGAGGYRLGAPLTLNTSYVIGPMVGDFDGDGRDDIALMIGEVNGRPQTLAVFSNDSRDGWTQRTQTTISAAFGGWVIDYDNDGDDDLASNEVFLRNSVRVYTGDQYAPLSRSGIAYLPFDPGGMLITDFDGDGWKSMTIISTERAPGTNTYLYRLHEMRPVPFGLTEIWSYDLPLGARSFTGVWDYDGDKRDDLICSFGEYSS